MAFKSYREASKENYGRELAEGESMSNEGLRTGALLRISDAVEKMAQEYDRILRDRNYQKDKAERLEREAATLRRSVAAYKGLLKRRV